MIKKLEENLASFQTQFEQKCAELTDSKQNLSKMEQKSAKDFEKINTHKAEIDRKSTDADGKLMQVL